MMLASFESVLSDSRIITPACDHASTFSMLATRATIEQSPLTCW